MGLGTKVCRSIFGGRCGGHVSLTFLCGHYIYVNVWVLLAVCHAGSGEDPFMEVVDVFNHPSVRNCEVSGELVCDELLQ